MAWRRNTKISKTDDLGAGHNSEMPQGQSSIMVKCQFQKMFSHCVFYYCSVRFFQWISSLAFKDAFLLLIWVIIFSYFLSVGQGFTIFLYYFTALQLVFLTHLSPHFFFLLLDAPFGNTVATMQLALQHPEQLITENNTANTETSCFPLNIYMWVCQGLECILEFCKPFVYH